MKKSRSKKNNIDNPQDLELNRLAKATAEKDGQPETNVLNKPLGEFLQAKKKEMKETIYRRRFDDMYNYVTKFGLNTADINPASNTNTNAFTPIFFNTDGTGVPNEMVLQRPTLESSTSSMPTSKEALLFSKIQIATSLLAAKLPDAQFKSDDKAFAFASYHLWKNNLNNDNSNALLCFQSFVQNVCTYGWGAFKTYPRQIVQKSGKVNKYLFDDVYYQPLNVNRTWFGIGATASDIWSRTEWLYEEDIPYQELKYKLELAGVPAKAINEEYLDFCHVSVEGQVEDSNKEKTHVTITYYENELTNSYLVACGSYFLYNGELIDPSGACSISCANFMKRLDIKDPHGVGLVEILRPNVDVINHLRREVLEQAEAETKPTVFASGSAESAGDNRIKKNQINWKPAGTTFEMIRTTGNIAGTMGVINDEHNSMDAISGINDIIAGLGGDSTLGATVIQKEAAMQRLALVRTSITKALERSAYQTVSLQKYIYSNEDIEVFDTDEMLNEFKEKNPSYFVKQEKIGEQVINYVTPVVRIPAQINVNTDEKGNKLESFAETQENVQYERSELMSRLDEIKGLSDLCRILEIIIDPNTMLQPSEEIQRQAIIGLAPIISTQVIQAIDMARQDPEKGAVLIKIIMKVLEANKEDPYNWLPKELVDQILSGAMVDQQMQQLGMANRMGAIAEQMQNVGMPQRGQDMNNVPQTPNSMQDAYNGSVGKLGI